MTQIVGRLGEYQFFVHASLTLHAHSHPAANGAWGAPLYTADFRLRIEGLLFNAHTT
jgi:hypothetical protein